MRIAVPVLLAAVLAVLLWVLLGGGSDPAPGPVGTDPGARGAAPETAGDATPPDAEVPPLPPPPDAPPPDEPAPTGEAAPTDPAAAKEADLPRLLKETEITVRFDDTSLLDALLLVASEVGVSLDVSEDLREELGSARVNLAADGLEAGSALELLLLLAGGEYAYAPKGGRIHVFRR